MSVVTKLSTFLNSATGCFVNIVPADTSNIFPNYAVGFSNTKLSSGLPSILAKTSPPKGEYNFFTVCNPSGSTGGCSSTLFETTFKPYLQQPVLSWSPDTTKQIFYSTIKASDFPTVIGLIVNTFYKGNSGDGNVNVVPVITDVSITPVTSADGTKTFNIGALTLYQGKYSELLSKEGFSFGSNEKTENTIILLLIIILVFGLLYYISENI